MFAYILHDYQLVQHNIHIFASIYIKFYSSPKPKCVIYCIKVKMDGPNELRTCRLKFVERKILNHSKQLCQQKHIETMVMKNVPITFQLLCRIYAILFKGYTFVNLGEISVLTLFMTVRALKHVRTCST